MPTVVTKKYVFVRSRNTYVYLGPANCPPGYTDQGYMYESSKTVVKTNEKEHRPKPAEGDLINFQTNQAVQSTYVVIYGHAKSTSKVAYSWDCKARNQPHVVVTDLLPRNTPHPPDYTQYVHTGWEIDMRLKIKDEAMNLASLLVEYRESASMFYNLAAGLYKMYKDFKKGNIVKRDSRARKGIRKTAFDLRYKKYQKQRRKAFMSTDISNQYLQATYGIMPLAGDLFSIWYVLEKALARDLLKRFVVKRSREVNLSGLSNDDSGTLTVSQRAISYVKYNAERTSNFTVGNPAEWAFEATPFSFVLDWLFPIGDILSSLDALKSVDSTTTQVTEKREGTYTLDITKNVGDLPNVEEITKHSETYSSHERYGVYSIPLPTIVRYQPSKSFRTIANGLALLHQIRSNL